MSFIDMPIHPPTPGPRKLNNIHEDAKDRFAGVIWLQIDSNDNKLSYLSDFDYFEKYDETKAYSRRKFLAAYKGAMKEYQNLLCILNDGKEDNYYVVAKHIIGDLEALEPFCPCINCTAWNINPLKHIWCATCRRCIKAGLGLASEENIKIAKERKRLAEYKKNNPSKYQKYLDKIEWIKAGEILGTLIIISSLTMYLW